MLRYILVVVSVYVPKLLASYSFKDLIPLGLTISETPTNSIIGNRSEIFCPKQDYDPFYRIDKLEFKLVDRPLPPGRLEPFQNGFFKSTCFSDTIDYEPDEICIFVNPTINYGKGMVIIATESLLMKSFKDGLDLSADPVDPEAMKVVRMPEKGGMGAVAAHKLQYGDPVILERPVGLFPVTGWLWASDLGKNIRRQAIDHLPAHTRAAVTRLYGNGETEDELLSDVVDKNVFSTSLPGDPEISYGALVLDGSRLNHACRPNVAYHINPRTQTFRMSAMGTIEAGAELTDSYRGLALLREERRESLKSTYGFDCTCSHCQMSKEQGELSDQRILRIEALMAQENFTPDQVQELLDLCERENIPWYKFYTHVIAAKFYNWQGRSEQVKEHAQAAKTLLLLLGPTTNDLAEVEMLLNTPENHSSHFSRLDN